jgi:FdhD protein
MEATESVWARRLRDGRASEVQEDVIAEEPLEVRLGGRRYTATMRTPNTNAHSDEELALGLLLGEGIIRDEGDVESISCRTLCRERSQELVNVVDVTLHDPSSIPEHLWERSLISNASCGLCGKASVEAMQLRLPALPTSTWALPPAALWRAADDLRALQPLFERTGGLHAAALCGRDGKVRIVREDIGRHNATDKAIGGALRDGWLRLDEEAENEREDGPQVLVVSGRASFEIVQKALAARIAVVAAVSAASSLAVELARAHNQTLVGWLRPGRATIYCGRERLEATEATEE